MLAQLHTYKANTKTLFKNCSQLIVGFGTLYKCRKSMDNKQIVGKLIQLKLHRIIGDYYTFLFIILLIIIIVVVIVDIILDIFSIKLNIFLCTVLLPFCIYFNIFKFIFNISIFNIQYFVAVHSGNVFAVKETCYLRI